MATTFVRVPSLEQQYDLWALGLLWCKRNTTSPPMPVPPRMSDRTRESLLASWAVSARVAPQEQYGYMSEE